MSSLPFVAPDLPNLMLLALVLVALLVLLRWQKSHPNFDLADLLTGDNGKVSLKKFGQASALAVSTWAFVVLVQQGKLTEFYFIGYMTVWAGLQLVQAKIDKGP